MLRGNNVLIVTPFNDKAELDGESLVNLIDHVIADGVDGVIALGTTGEFFSLNDEEKKRVIDITAERVGDKAALIVGVAHSGSDIASGLARYSKTKGASAVLAPPPYYITPSIEGMVNHFSIIAEKGEVDLMVYDGGGGIEVPISVIDKVRKNSSKMRYIKLTTPKPEKIKDYYELFNDEISVFAGEDLLIMPELIQGAVGLTTAAGNLQPAILSSIFNLVQEKRYEEAQRLHDKHIAPQAIVTGSIRNEFIQCFKTSLKLMGIIKNDVVRSPLSPISESRIQNLTNMLRNQKLI